MSKKRKRMSPEKIKQHLKQGDRGSSWLNLPDGVTSWSPDGSGKYAIDVIPYEVSVDNRPDNVEEGTIWWERQFTVHFGVGANNQAIVCPTSIGKRCPIHEDRAKLEKKYGKSPSEEQKETLKALGGKKQIAMNIKDPDAPKKVRVFTIASGKFLAFKAGGLQKELDEGDEENISFFDVKGGKTLNVRFSDESFGGHGYIQASKFDFEDRPDMDEDKILAKTVDLDKALNILPYDKIKEMYLMEDDEEGTGEKSEDEDEEKPRKKKPSKDEDEDEPEEDDEDSDSDDDEEEEKPKKKGSKKKASDDDDDEEEEDDEDGVTLPKKKSPKGKKASKKDEDEDDDDDSDEDDDSDNE